MQHCNVQRLGEGSVEECLSLEQFVSTLKYFFILFSYVRYL